jgi:hypothetical protein
MAVYQGGEGSAPPLLHRFQAAVGGVGRIHGPARGYLYQWHSKRHVVVDSVSELLWPWLSDAKRSQLERAAFEVGRTAPRVGRARWSAEENAAWAAGFFDGEGTIGVYGDPRWPTVSMSLPQSSESGVPDTLERFHRAVGVGAISGPRMVPSPWTKLPQYCWRSQRFVDIESAVELLRPYSDSGKLGEMDACLQQVRDVRTRRTG